VLDSGWSSVTFEIAPTRSNTCVISVADLREFALSDPPVAGLVYIAANMPDAGRE